MSDKMKNIVINTIKEIEENSIDLIDNKKDINNDKIKLNTLDNFNKVTSPDKEIDSETEFLLNIREKLLVLFTGLQSNDIKSLDKKLDMTLNFLEYELSMIEDRIKNIKEK